VSARFFSLSFSLALSFTLGLRIHRSGRAITRCEMFKTRFYDIKSVTNGCASRSRQNDLSAHDIDEAIYVQWPTDLETIFPNGNELRFLRLMNFLGQSPG
jgi:hypothetical protein